MALGDVLDDGQAQPRAADRAASARVHAVEALGQARQVRLGDAFAAVDHLHTHGLATVGGSRAHQHGLARTAIFERVAEQVVE